MIKRRLEKLELRFPPSPANLLDRLDCRAMATLSHQERILVNEVYAKSTPKKLYSPGHQVAVDHYSEALSQLMHDVSDEELHRMIAEVESRIGGPISVGEFTL
jgi:hypothetical protein